MNAGMTQEDYQEVIATIDLAIVKWGEAKDKVMDIAALASRDVNRQRCIPLCSVGRAAKLLPMHLVRLKDALSKAKSVQDFYDDVLNEEIKIVLGTWSHFEDAATSAAGRNPEDPGAKAVHAVNLAMVLTVQARAEMGRCSFPGEGEVVVSPPPGVETD